MNEITVTGIVVGSTDVSENDRMVRILTKEGPLSFYAKGVNKMESKNRPSLTVFTKSKFILFEGRQGGHSLKTGVIEETYLDLSSYDQLAIASLMEELCKLFVNELTDGDFYSFLENGLEGISNGEEPLHVCLSFVAKLLKGEGIGFPKLPDASTEGYSYLYESIFSYKRPSKVISYGKNDVKKLILDCLGYICSSMGVTLRSLPLVSVL